MAIKTKWGKEFVRFLYILEGKKYAMPLWAITVTWKEQTVWLMADWIL